MPRNWKTYNLEEVLEIKNGKTKPKNLGNIPIYGGNGILGFGDKSNLSQEAILIGRVGAYCGAVYFENREIWVSDNSLFGIAKMGFDTKFIYYLLKWADLNRYSTGSSQPLLTQGALNSLEFEIPEIQEQKSIASILSTLDDKIELNLQMNNTLEEMALALYKHWFVDFGPFQDGEFIDSELGEIPKGWEVKAIGDVIETLGGGTPKTKVLEYWENGNIDWYSPTDLTKADSLFSFGTAKKITKKGLEKSSAKMFPARSLLMSSRATIGAITINRKPACTNQGFITMIPNETLTLFQLHGWTVHNMNLILSKANGSTFKEISKANFRALPILIGSGISEYITEVENYYAQIENNLLENQTLTQLRDTLLPKLISGEVRVKDVEKTLTEVL